MVLRGSKSKDLLVTCTTGLLEVLARDVMMVVIVIEMVANMIMLVERLPLWLLVAKVIMALAIVVIRLSIWKWQLRYCWGY